MNTDMPLFISGMILFLVGLFISTHWAILGSFI
ncbi:hypothetical protein HNQ94_000920 [Salirhabdus euzebyi]|uniref:Uncharacterized protein n=1 Tax=Salirhabdus euzebyi TaxID=394506 RepID=A0A841Q2E9_9BACI|nr:hypothetical protein [Salirhabdus euzebyi]